MKDNLILIVTLKRIQIIEINNITFGALRLKKLHSYDKIVP
jgi:hypothetical protein